jgi:aryl-alcohol dehydrogenase-like predicted oxidoreductase
MQYRRLRSTGTRVSGLCFGTWRFGKETNGVVETGRMEAHELLDAAWDRRIDFLDAASVYGTPNDVSKKYIREWLEDHNRTDFLIASKVYFPFDGW